MRVTVWKGYRGVGESCVLLPDGNYRGLASGRLYPAGEYRHSPVYRARVVRMLATNETGMIYRHERDHPELIGHEVDAEESHMYGEHRVWRCYAQDGELAYLADGEIALLSEGPIR